MFIIILHGRIFITYLFSGNLLFRMIGFDHKEMAIISIGNDNMINQLKLAEYIDKKRNTRFFVLSKYYSTLAHLFGYYRVFRISTVNLLF